MIEGNRRKGRSAVNGQLPFDAFHVNAADFPQLSDGSLLYETVGQSHAGDVRTVAMVVHPFSNGRSQTAVPNAVLDGDNA